MKRKNPYFISDKLQKEFEATRRKIASVERKREKLLKQIAETPSVKLQKRLAALDEAIAENTRKLPSEAFLGLLAGFDNYGLQMLAVIEKYDDKLLLTAGDDAPQIQIVNMMQENRNTIHDSDNENKFEILTGLDAVINKLRDIIEEKRIKATARFPELARKIKPPEHEMPEFYKEALKEFIEMVERRDKLRQDITFVAPEKRAEFQKNLAESERIVEEAEQGFADIYERFQKKQQYLDQLRNLLKQGSKTDLKELREHLKKNPSSNGALELLLREEFPE